MQGSFLRFFSTIDQQHADTFLIAPLLQVGGDFPVRPGQEGGVLHLGDLLPHGHLAHQVRGAGEVANSWICVCRLVEALQGRAVPWVKLGYTLVPSAVSSFLNFSVSSL